MGAKHNLGATTSIERVEGVYGCLLFGGPFIGRCRVPLKGFGVGIGWV